MEIKTFLVCQTTLAQNIMSLPNMTGCGGGSSSTCQRKDNLQEVHTQEAQTFGTKIYKLRGFEWIYVYDKCISLGKDRTCDYT